MPAGGSAGCWGWRCGLDALSASFLPPTSPSWQPSRPLPAHHGRVPSPKRSAPTRLRAMMMLALLLWRRAASPSNVGRPEGCRPRMPARFTAVTLHTVVTLAAAPSHDRVIPRCGHVVGRHPIAQCVPAARTPATAAAVAGAPAGTAAAAVSAARRSLFASGAAPAASSLTLTAAATSVPVASASVGPRPAGARRPSLPLQDVGSRLVRRWPSRQGRR